MEQDIINSYQWTSIILFIIIIMLVVVIVQTLIQNRNSFKETELKTLYTFNNLKIKGDNMYYRVVVGKKGTGLIIPEKHDHSPAEVDLTQPVTIVSSDPLSLRVTQDETNPLQYEVEFIGIGDGVKVTKTADVELDEGIHRITSEDTFDIVDEEAVGLPTQYTEFVFPTDISPNAPEEVQ